MIFNNLNKQSQSLAAVRDDHDADEEKKSLDNVVVNDQDDNEVASWLRDVVKLPQYIPQFMELGFDDLFTVKEIGVGQQFEIKIDKLGHKIKIMAEMPLIII